MSAAWLMLAVGLAICGGSLVMTAERFDSVSWIRRLAEARWIVGLHIWLFAAGVFCVSYSVQVLAA